MIYAKKTHTILLLLFFITTLCFSQKDSVDYFKKVDSHIKLNQKEEAYTLSYKQLEKAIDSHNIPLQIKWNNTLGELFKHNNSFLSALKHFTNAKKLSTQQNDSLTIANAYFNIGSLNLLEYSKITYKEQRTDVALDKRDAAIKKFNFVIANFEKYNGAEKTIAKTYANLTGIHSYKGEYDRAEKTSKKAITHYQKIHDTISIIGVQINLAVSQMYQGQLTKSEKTHLDALPFLKDTTNLKVLQFKTVALSNLAHIYGKKKQLSKSIDYLEKAHKLNMYMLEKSNNKALVEIEAKYNQESLIQEEQAKLNIAIAENKTTKLWFWISGLAGTSFLLLAIALYRNSKLKQRSLELKITQDAYVKNQELQKLNEQNQYNILNATLDGKVNERKLIAQTLHDSVSALLSSAKMHLQVVKKKSSTPIEELDKSQRIITEASNKIRDLSHHLISAILLKLGLKAAIDDLCEKYSNDALKFSLITSCEIPRFNQNFEIRVHNIIQEISNNIIKHSQATKASITIDIKHNKLIITITDNGIGFNPTKVKTKKGIGLSQVKARIESANGKLKIQSKKNKGTTIFIEKNIIPL